MRHMLTAKEVHLLNNQRSRACGMPMVIEKKAHSKQCGGSNWWYLLNFCGELSTLAYIISMGPQFYYPHFTGEKSEKLNH